MLKREWAQARASVVLFLLSFVFLFASFLALSAVLMCVCRPLPLVFSMSFSFSLFSLFLLCLNFFPVSCPECVVGSLPLAGGAPSRIIRQLKGRFPTSEKGMRLGTRSAVRAGERRFYCRRRAPRLGLQDAALWSRLVVELPCSFLTCFSYRVFLNVLAGVRHLVLPIQTAALSANAERRLNVQLLLVCGKPLGLSLHHLQPLLFFSAFVDRVLGLVVVRWVSVRVLSAGARLACHIFVVACLTCSLDKALAFGGVALWAARLPLRWFYPLSQLLSPPHAFQSRSPPHTHTQTQFVMLSCQPWSAGMANTRFDPNLFKSSRYRSRAGFKGCKGVCLGRVWHAESVRARCNLHDVVRSQHVLDLEVGGVFVRVDDAGRVEVEEGRDTGELREGRDIEE